MSDITQVERCIIAIHDHGTRDSATRSSVMKALKSDGFTADDIRQATQKMTGEDHTQEATFSKTERVQTQEAGE